MRLELVEQATAEQDAKAFARDEQSKFRWPVSYKENAALYGAISRVSVNLIMHTGGA